MLWSYVRLLHKPQCAGTERGRTGWGGRGVCCTITKRIRTAPNPPPITHAYRPTHHNNNMFDFWSNMCCPQDNRTLPSVNIMTHIHIHKHTQISDSYPLCEKALFLSCTQVPQPHALSLSAIEQPVPDSTCLFPQETPADNDKLIRVSSQGSIACIQNILLPSHARRFVSVTTATCHTPKCVAYVPQQKCLFLTLYHPVYPLRDLGCGGGKMEEGR